MEISLTIADRQGLRWAQRRVAEEHYLRAPVDPRCRPLAYLVEHQASWGAHAAAGPRVVGILIFGRPEATKCYDGPLSYGSAADVAAGRARFDRWEILNLARVWFSPVVQAGGVYHNPEWLPGYGFTDRRGVWRSTLPSQMIATSLARVGADYLRAYPPVDCAQPYQIRAVLSYCDTTLHRGALYRASGFALARTNDRGIETYYTEAVASLTDEEDAQIRVLAERSGRSRRIRSQRATTAQQERLL